MGVSLTKGGNVSLTKEAPNLTAVVVGLGWDARSTTGAAFDLDAAQSAQARTRRSSPTSTSSSSTTSVRPTLDRAQG